MMSRLRTLLVIILCLSVTVSAADEVDILVESSDSNRSPFEVDPSVDVPIIMTGFLIDVAAALSDNSYTLEITNMDPGRINKIDRMVIGNWNQTADGVSDVLRTSVQTAPFLLNLIDVLISDSSDGLSGFGKDSLVLLEVLAVENTVNTMFKFVVQRPRPYTYNPRISDSRRNGGDASLSFFSGHTTLSFSMATAYSYLFTKRHPDSPLVIPVWLITHAMAGSTAVLRVEAGQHFWSDVLVGAAVGSAIGFLVPYLHTLDGEDSRLPGNLMVLPLLYPGGFGASATLVF